jgi:hypothetical protein
MTDTKLTAEDLKEIALSYKEEDEVAFSMEEEAYRRGYEQGFYAARNKPELTLSEVQIWRHSREDTAPPGSGMAGMRFK